MGATPLNHTAVQLEQVQFLAAHGGHLEVFDSNGVALEFDDCFFEFVGLLELLVRVLLSRGLDGWYLVGAHGYAWLRGILFVCIIIN